MANLMLYAWTCHHIPPSDFYKMSFGEKKIINAFYEKEFELNRKRK